MTSSLYESKKQTIQDGFEITKWEDVRYCSYIRLADDESKQFARVKMSSDGERYVIHIGRRYCGYSRTEESAIDKAKKALKDIKEKRGKK